jgi:5-methyltetrahydrofolate--homocysteine methyltransferase
VVTAALSAAKKAREASQKEVFIAGSIGPSTRNISLAIDLKEEELRESYKSLVEALHNNGADIFLIESITDVRNAEIAAEVCREVAPETPIIFSAVLSKIGGLLISGRSVEKYVEDITKFNPLAIGFNCSHGVKNVVDSIELLTRFTSLPTYAAPSAGIPDAKGKYPETVKKHTETLRTAAERGLLSIVGGCCGTTAEYTRSIAQMARHYKARK